MLKLNDNGDLEIATPDGSYYATAAELRAAGLVRGEVGISVEDARQALWAISDGGVECRGDKCRDEWCRSCWDEETVQAAIQKKDAVINRLRAAIAQATKENEHD